MRGLCKETVRRIAEHHFQSKGHAAGSTAHAAGQVDEERMLFIDDDAQSVELLFQSERGHGVAEEEGLGIFVVHKMAVRVICGQPAALGHGDAVIGLVLHHLDSAAAQEVFFPLPRVRRHVDGDFEAEFCAHDADGEAEVAGGADSDGVAGEQLPERLGVQHGVIVRQVEHPALEGDVLRRFQHLIDAAAGLDGACHRQMAVHLEEQIAGDGAARCFDQAFLHLGDGLQRGLDDAIGALGLREALADERGKPLQTRLCICNVCVRDDQLAHSVGHFKGQELGVDPQSLFLLRDLL